MARFLLVLLALVAAGLPIFAHAYAVEALDGVVPRRPDMTVTLFSMAWAGFPVMLAAILAHRPRAVFLGVLAFAAEAALWAFYATSLRAAAAEPGVAEVAAGFLTLAVPPVLAAVILLGTRQPRSTKLRF